MNDIWLWWGGIAPIDPATALTVLMWATLFLALAGLVGYLVMLADERDAMVNVGEVPHVCICDGCAWKLFPHGPRRHPLKHVAIRFGTPNDHEAVVYLDGERQAFALEAFEGNPGWLIRASRDGDGDVASFHACRACRGKEGERRSFYGHICIEMVHGKVEITRPLVGDVDDDTPLLYGPVLATSPSYINNPPEAAT